MFLKSQKMKSPKKLLQMTRKWQSFAAAKRKRISFSLVNQDSSTSMVVDKDHFAAYTVDGNRFAIPLAYLHTDVFRQLLEISEEVFGIPSDGPLTFPCDAVFMNYIISLIRKGVCGDMQRALLTSIADIPYSSSSFGCREFNQLQPVCILT